jgi:hypothetical protein
LKDYNKWYINVTITKWLQPPSILGLNWSGPGKNEVVKVLAYVDEFRTGEGAISRDYVGRMNRGIEESVALGLPRRWVDKVMKRWVVPDIFPDHGYIGTNEGYIPEEEEAEAGTEVAMDFSAKIQPVLECPDRDVVLRALRDLAEGRAASVFGTVVDSLSGLSQQTSGNVSNSDYQKAMTTLLTWGMRNYLIEPSINVMDLWTSMSILDGPRGYA